MKQLEISVQEFSKVNLSNFDPNQGLNRGASRWKEMAWYIIKVFIFQSPLPYPSKFKVLLLRLFGAKVGVGIIIKPRVNIHFPWKLKIGNHSWIGEEAVILNFENLSIGSNVCISQRAFLCGGNHNYKQPEMPYLNGPIQLKDGCWIGANSFIGPNVTVGVDSVVTANSLLSKSIPDNVIFGGNPAKYIKLRW